MHTASAPRNARGALWGIGHLTLLLLFCLMPTLAAWAQKALRLTEVSGFPDDEAGYALGVSACFAGVIGDEVIMAGGCNFPDNSGVKRYYDGIYAAQWRGDTLRWRRIGTLPEPTAYGATVALGDRLLFIGGNNSRHSMRSVMALTLNAQGQAVLTSLPPLPVTMDNGAAACTQGKLFVFGGNQDGKPAKALWSLHLQRPKARWTRHKGPAGQPRVQPVAVALGARLFVWGGYHADGDRSLVATDGWAYDLSRNRWSRLSAPTDRAGATLTLSGATGCATTGHLVVCLGGVNKDIFADAISGKYRLVDKADYLKQSVAWYRFNQTPLLFDTRTCNWQPAPAPDARLARAGAQLVACGDGQLLYIGGELKPGVRTPQVLRIQLQ